MTEIANLSVRIGADTGSLDRGLKQADTSITGFVKNAGKTLATLGAGITLLTAPLTAFGVTGINVAADFEASMAEISARTGIVGDDLEMISDFALQMGADTAFSAQQASDAFLQLLSSGQSAEEAMATLPAVLDLAAASGADLGSTADTVTDIMAQFGLEVDASADVANTLAQAAGASSASIQDLSASFANVGPIANQMGLDVTETAAVLAIFAENGIKGAEAGTQLKSMLLNFNSDRAKDAFSELGVSLYDAEGNLRDFSVVIGELDVALDKLPVEEQNRLMLDLAGSYGITGLAALRGSVSIDQMTASMEGAADAETVAGARMDTFKGKVDSLGGSIETLQITVMEPFMDDVLAPMAEEATNVANSFTEWAKANPELSNALVGLGGVAVVVGPGLIGIGLAAQAAAVGFGVLTAAAGVLLSPVILVGGAIALLGVAIASDWPGFVQGVETAWTNLSILFDDIKLGIRQFIADVELRLDTWIGLIRQKVLDLTGQDIAPNFVVETDINRTDILRMNVEDDVRKILQDQLDSGTIDLTVPLHFKEEIGGEWVNLTGTLQDAISDPKLIEFMGTRGRLLVEDALAAAFVIDDQLTIELLTPAAVKMGIDIDALQTETEQQIIAAVGDLSTLTEGVAKERVEKALENAFTIDDQQTIKLLTPLAVDMGIDVASMEDQFAVVEGTIQTFFDELEDNTQPFEVPVEPLQIPVEPIVLEGFDFTQYVGSTDVPLPPEVGTIVVDGYSIELTNPEIATPLSFGDALSDFSEDDLLLPAIPISPDLAIDTTIAEQTVSDALKAAFAIDDQYTIDLLTPTAVVLGIDLAALEADVDAQIQSGNYDTTVSAAIAINAIVNVTTLVNQVVAEAGDAINDAIGAIEDIGEIHDQGGELPPADVEPPLAVGTPMVNSTGIALIHQGEAVLTPPQAEAWRTLLNNPGAAAANAGRQIILNVTAFGSPAELAQLIKRELELAGI